eukprot:TRINITY_DN10054_c0_g1_i1.p1 TRINITY_DN10054_c0_g1~~TRINITY_DN10054_c0_g1_i1.p1  ORF type:complete len:654 (-),score=179.77 TRINITY_DN10054_c0_g1_i1:516-2477(-)
MSFIPVLLSEGGGEEEAELHVVGIHLNEVSAFLLAVIVLLLIVAALRMLIFIYEIKFVPESGIVILFGCVLALIVVAAHFDHLEVLQFNPEIFFLVLIPPIIFEAGFALDNNAFFSNVFLILAFALVGTFINTVFMGIVLFLISPLYLVHVTLMDMLTFGALISAVDPVAVIAIFDAVHVNPTLHILVFGESVLNDAVSIVLYTVFNSLRNIPHLTWVIPGLALSKFFWVSFVGVLIGCILALICAFVLRINADPAEIGFQSCCFVPLKDRHTVIPFLPARADEEFEHHRYLLEPLIIGLFAALSFILAEIFLASGIVATLFCGILMSLYVVPNINHKSLVAVSYVSKVLAGATESLVFLYLGMSTVFHLFQGFGVWDPALTCFTIVLMIFARFVLTFGITAIANTQRGFQKIGYRDQFVMAYGGLRGAIAFALAFILEEEMQAKDHIITATLAAIWFTVFVQGSTIKPILNCLHVRLASAELKPEQVVLSKSFPMITDAVKMLTGNRSLAVGERFFGRVDAFIRWCVVRKANQRERELFRSLKSLRKMQLKEDIEGDEMAESHLHQWQIHNPHVNLQTAASVAGIQRSKREDSDGGSDLEDSDSLNESLMSLMEDRDYRRHKVFQGEPGLTHLTSSAAPKRRRKGGDNPDLV